MTDLAAIQGNYADFKLVKTRKVAQLVIEIPIERAKQAIDAFGVPQPHAEIAVAVARLNHPEPSTEPKELTRSQWAGLRCKDAEFRKWLNTQIGPDISANILHDLKTYKNSPDHEVAAAVLRRVLNIQSRKELDSNPAKQAAWDELDTAFKQATGRMAEKH